MILPSVLGMLLFGLYEPWQWAGYTRVTFLDFSQIDAFGVGQYLGDTFGYRGVDSTHGRDAYMRTRNRELVLPSP